MLEDANLLDHDSEESSGSRTWGTGINVNGVNYAVSLFWQPLQNSNDYMQEVENASNTVLEGADLFCIKGGKAPQFGICVSHEGYKSGQTSAAVSLSSALGNVSSFVAVFHTNEGWWYTCIRNDIILSDGDMLFLSEEDAKNQFLSMMAVPDWGKKIAPAEWKIEDTEQADLENLLVRGARAKLQKIKGLRGTKLLVVVVLSAIVGIWLASSVIDKLFLTPAPRPVVVPVKPKAAEPVEVKEVPKPWSNIKNPSQVMKNCYDGIVKIVGVLPPGWRIGQVSCVDANVATSWSKEYGRLSIAEEALKASELPFSAYSFDAGGNNVSASMPIEEAETMESPPEYSLIDLRNKINDHFQSLGLPIALSEETIQVAESQAPQGPARKGPGAPQPAVQTVFRALRFSFDSPHEPMVWMDLLIKYSGLTIKMITYNPASDVWHYEGAIYVL